MKKVCFCLKMPHKSYIGGVAAVVNAYLESSDVFESLGYHVALYDYQNEKIDRLKFSPLQTALYGYGQWKGLCKQIKEIDILHIHTSCRSLFLKDVLLLTRLHKKYGTQIVLTIHVGDIDTVFRKIPKFLHRKLIENLNKNVSAVCFLSEVMRKQFISVGLNESICKTLYNFHDFNFKESSIKPVGKILNLLFVGMINRDKGIIELIKAINNLPDVPLHLNICGTITDESIRNEYEEQVLLAGDRVTQNGYVKGEIKKRVFESSDVLILPSYHEGLPLVILEALAAGCAIISTRVGATPELLSEESVIWIEMKSVEDIEVAIRTLYEDKELCERMKHSNYLLSKTYAKDAHIKKLCGIYQES